MSEWIRAVFWCCVLVAVPGFTAAAIRTRTLPRHRLPESPGAPMIPGIWRLSDADSRNYTEPGKRALRISKLLVAFQMVGFVVWMFLFII